MNHKDTENQEINKRYLKEITQLKQQNSKLDNKV